MRTGPRDRTRTLPGRRLLLQCAALVAAARHAAALPTTPAVRTMARRFVVNTQSASNTVFHLFI